MAAVPELGRRYLYGTHQPAIAQRGLKRSSATPEHGRDAAPRLHATPMASLDPPSPDWLFLTWPGHPPYRPGMDRRRFLRISVASICCASARGLSLLPDAVTRSAWPCLILLAALAPAFAADSTTTPGTAASWGIRAVGAIVGILLMIYGLFTVPGTHKKYENY
jgi:hypothetical protein